MQINDQGTFYVEGEYKAGETVLTAGDWELVADVDGSKKYCVGYDADISNINLFNNEVTLDADTGWAVYGDTVLTKTESGFRLEGFGQYRSAGQRVQLKKGATYFVFFEFWNESSNAVEWLNSLTGTQWNTDGTKHSRSFFITPTSDVAAAFSFRTGYSTSGGVVWFRNPKIVEITPSTKNTLTNSDFLVNEAWLYSEGNWLIEGRKAKALSAGGALVQRHRFKQGVQYDITFEVTDYVSGSVRPRFTGGAVADGDYVTGNGVFTQRLTGGGNTEFRFESSAGTSLAINTVEVVPCRDTALSNGHHKDFRYYPYKLSEAEITELTR